MSGGAHRPRLLVYVQSLMGTGHLQRSKAIATAAAAAHWQVSLVSGGMPVPGFDPGPVDCVQLPPARCPDLAYDRLVDAQGAPVDERWRARRAAALMSAWRAQRPDAVLIETFPFGRKLLRFELLPWLETIRAQAPATLVVSSIRDIIDYRAKPSKYADMARLARRYFDGVLVHADPCLVPLEASFPLIDELAGLVHYTGYVRQGAAPAPAPRIRGDEVVVSVGGGGYGAELLRVAMAARPLGGAASSPWRALLGVHVAAAERDALAAAAPPGFVVEPAREDFPALLAQARLSISRGGYNTMLDVLASGVPAVVVPYHDSTEREQLLRAQALAARGWIEMLRNDELTPEALAAAVDRALARPVPPAADTGAAPTGLDLDGAAHSARILRVLLERRRAGAGAAL